MISKAKIKLINSLKSKKYREKHKLFVVEGEKSIQDLLQAGMKAVSVFALSNIIEHFNDIDCELAEVSSTEMKKISFLKTPGNSLALFEQSKNLFEESFKSSFVLVLDNVQDPGNLGTIIRVADWFGVQDIVCSDDSADIYNPKVVQASMGSIARVKVYYTNLSEYLQNTKTEYTVYGSFMEGNPIYETDFQEKKIVVMGNEGKGISSDIEKLIDEKISIPRFTHKSKGPESLNVAMATGIILSEIKRKK